MFKRVPQLLQYFLVIAILAIVYLISNTTLVYAIPCRGNPALDCQGSCEYLGQCADNLKECIVSPVSTRVVIPAGPDCGNFRGSRVIGHVVPPKGVDLYNAKLPGGSGKRIGIFFFFSRSLVLLTVVLGIAVFVNFLIAGYTIISKSGDSNAFSEARERLTYSVMGIAIITSVYIVAAIIGLIFFGDATFILKPDINQFSAI